MNTKIHQNKKGFTLIELLAVIMLIAIIGAVLIPLVSKMSIKARLTSDISSIKTFQRQIDIYKIEQNVYPGVTGDFSVGEKPQLVGPSVGGDLVGKGYIDAKDLIKDGTTGYKLKLQTGGTLYAVRGSCYLFVTQSDYVALINALEATDVNLGWVKHTH